MAGGGVKKGKHRKEKRTELTNGSSLIEGTPRDAVTNAFRLHHPRAFAYRISKINKAFDMGVSVLVSGCDLQFHHRGFMHMHGPVA
jgi:hypothetical protein